MDIDSNITLWDHRWLDMALMVSSWSKDPRYQIGAVIVRDRQLLSIGYNGFPKGYPDDAEKLADRKAKNLLTIHAEKNAIYNAGQNGVKINGATIYVWGLPTCSQCMNGIAQVGIKRVVSAYPPNIPEKYELSNLDSRDIAQTLHIKYNELIIDI
jgi:dCMP deaminase